MTLLGDTSRPCGVTFAFTERTGGVSVGEFASLNLGSRCGDKPEAVEHNRKRALEALGAARFSSNLVEPKQVHGSNIVVVRSESSHALEAARMQARAGADGIICKASNVPVLLCFADCVPIVLVAPGIFAVIHSGWRGTLARISAKAVQIMCKETAVLPEQILAYVGPHILGADYEVSPELIATFNDEFATIVTAEGAPSHLDLSACIAHTLQEVGVLPQHIVDTCCSTATNTDRFYSYRAEGGACGRHAAIAFMATDVA